MVFKKIYKCLFIPNCTTKIMWLLINNTLEKRIDNLKPLTIHLLLRYTEGIAFDLLKLGKASKISGDLRRSPEIVVSLRKCSDDLRKTSEVFGCSSEMLGSVWATFGNVWKVSCGLRYSSEGFARSSEIFGRFRTIFGGLRNTTVGLRQSSF